MVKHIEARLAAVKGKVMIVAASRRIAVLLYDEIAKIRPDWVSEDENRGRMKVVMTGSASDPPEFQRHVRTKAERREIERRFKDPGDELQVVIVRDMWLTGFDVPPLHTMYIDKPMQGYGLMQAIARVNRVFGDKPGGLVVDYIGIGGELRKAVAEYSTSVGTGVAALQPEQVAEALQECSEVAEGLIHPYDCLDFEVADAAGKMRLAREVADHVLAMRGGEGVPDGRDRFLKAVTALRRAYALAAPSPLANEVKPTLVFLRVVASLLAPIKEPRTSANRATALDQEVEQLVSEAVVGEGVENILMLDGRIGIDALSDEFLQGIDQLPQKNLAAEMLRRLLEEEIARIARHSVVQGRKFSEALEKALIKYKNGLIDSAALIKTLVEFAQEIKAEANRGAELGMQSDEVAFYDALAVSESAVNVLGDAVLRKMAHRLVDLVRKNATIDWSRRESARANMRRLVKRVLREFQYPPDQEAAATEMVLSQAILLTDAVTGEEDPD